VPAPRRQHSGAAGPPPGWEENPPLPVEEWDAVKPDQATSANGGGRGGDYGGGQRQLRSGGGGGRGSSRSRGRGGAYDAPADVQDAGWDSQVSTDA
jgi:hypothetical protein